MATLSVDVDTIAIIRQARGGKEPDPVQAAVIAELAGAHAITAQLRDDRRHMQDRDFYLLKQTVTTHLNLKIVPSPDLIAFAIDLLPHMATLVPEKYQERSAEEGLLVRGKEKDLAKKISLLQDNGIVVCVFVDPDLQQIRAAKQAGTTHIELQTGYYANATGQAAIDELDKLRDAAFYASKHELHVNAGRGLNYHNISPVADLENIEEVNVGHALIARAALVGLEPAVRDLIALM